jgi:Rho GDP-dissociation inhibitor
MPPKADMKFASEESPSGMLARSGSYVVKSRIIDDDKKVWLDFEWGESHRARRG